MESLRRLDERFVPRESAERRAARAARVLPWILGSALLAQVAAVVTESESYDGFVTSGLVWSLVAVFLMRRGTPQP